MIHHGDIAKPNGLGASTENHGGGGMVLPEGWKQRRLCEVAQWGSGGTPSRTHPEYYVGDIPWIKTGELGRGYINDTEEHISRLALTNSSAKLYPAGSVAIAMYGATIGKTGRLGVPAACNQACAIAICNSICIPDYLHKYLDANLDQFRKLGQGGAQPNISQEILKNYPIPIPPLPEQERIAARLDLLLGKLKAARKRLDAVPEIIKRFRKSVLAEAVSGRLTEEWRLEHAAELPSAEELLAQVRKERRAAWEKAELEKMRAKGKVPRDDAWAGGYRGISTLYDRSSFSSPDIWGVLPLIELTDACRDLTYGIVQTGMAHIGGVPTVRCGDIKDFRIERKTLKLVDPKVSEAYPRTLLKGGEVLIAIRGSVGEVAVAAPDLLGCNISREVALIAPLRQVLPSYLMFALSADPLQNAIIGHTKGVAQQGINLEDLRNVATPLPSVLEQHEIVRRVDELFAYADALESRVVEARKLAERLEPSILAKAFRGELSEQIPEEAAEWERRLAELEKAASELGEKAAPKRGRKAKLAETGRDAPDGQNAGKRKPGRPKKVLESSEAPKGPRGRPRKA